MRIVSPSSKRDRTPFIGRQHERERLRAELRSGAGLVTLTGPSGIGKTRLARQVAGELIESFDGGGGVWLCSLAGCKDAVDLEFAVASTLEIRHQGEELARSIANRGPLLLILDNADSVAAHCGETLERWLERCVELQVIMTSLVPAGVPGEVVLELRPLEAEDAVALYLDRAHRAWADRSFSNEEVDEVQELVRRLDRLPLAIELAAARVRVLPPRTMLSMFEKRFELLRATPQTRDAGGGAHRRNASLLGAFELTWSYLDPLEQLVLAKAAVFEGGFTIEAAEAVLPAEAPSTRSSPGPSRIEVLQTLENLGRKSLLVHEDTSPPRFYLLESVQEYALRELQRMGRVEETIRRHAAYYLSQEEAQAQSLSERRQVEAIPWLKKERANLVAIQQRFHASDPSIAATAGVALAPLSLLEGDSASVPHLAEAALDAARRCGDSRLIVAALETIYLSHFRHGRFGEARAAIVARIELGGQIGDKAVEALALAHLAILNLTQGDLETGRPLLRRALQLSEEVDLPGIEAHVRLALGIEAWRNGAPEEAEANLVRSVGLFRQEDAVISSTKALYTLGVALAHQHRFEEARALMLEAIGESRSRPHEGHFISNLANIELSTGRLDEAEARYKQCLSIHRELGNRFQEGMSLGNLGLIALERGEIGVAADRFSQAEALFADCDAKSSRAELLIFVSVLEAIRGQLEEARHALDETRAYVASGGRGLSPLLVKCAKVSIDVAAARQLAEGAADKLESARVRLTSIRQKDIPWPSSVPILCRILEKELATRKAGAPHAPSRPAPLVLLLSASRDWFQLADGQRIDLSNRGVLRRVLAALVMARLDTPGVAVGTGELIQAGWPKIEMSQESAVKRLKFAIWALRELGLRSVIQNDPDGYLLDPGVRIEVRGEA